MTLTPAQRQALITLTHKPAHVQPPGTTIGRHQVAYTTAERLVIVGYARPTPGQPNTMGTIVITTKGRAALAQPQAEPDPVHLHAHCGLTTNRSKAARGEPEVIDPHTLGTWWTEQALLRKAQAAERKAAARRLRDRLRNQARAA